jgi:hypothetical protein
VATAAVAVGVGRRVVAAVWVGTLVVPTATQQILQTQGRLILKQDQDQEEKVNPNVFNANSCYPFNFELSQAESPPTCCRTNDWACRNNSGAITHCQ